MLCMLSPPTPLGYRNQSQVEATVDMVVHRCRNQGADYSIGREVEWCNTLLSEILQKCVWKLLYGDHTFNNGLKM